MVTLTASQGRLFLTLTAIPLGQDLCVTITGGDTPHLGAIAVSQARPSLENPSLTSTSTSVITLIGHKEDALAKTAAELLSLHLSKNVVVCCGIHLDNISHTEIILAEKLTQELLQIYLKRTNE